MDEIDVSEMERIANLPDDKFRYALYVLLAQAKARAEEAATGTDRIERALKETVCPQIRIHAERLKWHKLIGASVIAAISAWLSWVTVLVLGR